MNEPRLTAAERRVERLLERGYQPRRAGGAGQRLVALVPPGVVNSWDSRDTVWIRGSTLNNLARKRGRT